MRCPQCGLDTAPGAAFCSRCGTRVVAPRPAAIREYALDRVFTSWWRFAGTFVISLALIGFGIRDLYPPHPWQRGLILLGVAALILLRAFFQRRSTSWSLTSERRQHRFPDQARSDSGTRIDRRNHTPGASQAPRVIDSAPVPERCSAIANSRPDQSIIGVLLEAMRDPSGGAAQRENRRRQTELEPEHPDAHC